MRYILLIICNLVAVLSTLQYVKYIKPKSKSDFIMFSIIIYFFRIIVVELFLGYILKNIGYCTVSAMFILEFFILLVLQRVKKQENILMLTYNKISEILKKKYSINVVIVLISIIMLIAVLVSIVIYEYSYDGNYYHLPHIIDYIQNGKIYQTNNSLWNNVYPQNIELLNMFYMIFTSSVFCIRTPQILFSILGMTAVYKLLKEFKINNQAAINCAALYGVAPFIIGQITTTYIDGIGCTLFIFLIYMLNRIYKTKEFKYELLFYLAISIFIGTKGTYIIYSGILLITYLIMKIFCLIKKEEKISKVIPKFLLLGIAMCCVGCTWIIQNIIIFSNPIHPFKFLWISGMDANIDIGVENEPMCIRDKNSLVKILISWIGLSSPYLTFDSGMKFKNLFQGYDTRIGGLGIQWLYFLIPNCIVGVLLYLKKKIKLEINEIITILILILAFCITPANWWGRYVGYIIFVGYIFYGKVYTYFSKNKLYKIIDKIIIMILISTSAILSGRMAINILIYETPYSGHESIIQVSEEFRNYIECSSKKLVVLEDSYYKSTVSYVFLKGSYLQNKVDTYYIKEKYPNPGVKNHGIGTYENFKSIVESYEEINGIIILDSEYNRENLEYTEEYYLENNSKYTKKDYGYGVIVYEKN